MLSPMYASNNKTVLLFDAYMGESIIALAYKWLVLVEYEVSES